MAPKTDFKKTLDSYRARQGEIRVIEVPTMQYLMVDGHGDPNTSQEFADAITSLYPVAYKLKFASKQDSDMDSFTVARDKSAWDWTAMIMVPDWVTPAMFDAAVTKAEAKKPPSIDKVRLKALDEGTCVQTLHIGSFDDEAEILDELHHTFIPGNGLHMTGKHHEIYFSDFRKTEPSKLRTILRQPVTSGR